MAFQEPVRLSAAVNSKHDELNPHFSGDNRLYFVRTGSPANSGGVFARNQIWYADLDAGGANAKLFVPSGWKVKGSHAYSVVGIGDNGKTVFLLRNKVGQRVKGIYFSKVAGGQWTKPELIPIAGLESIEFFSAYVSPDFDVILFSLTQDGGFGQEDIYVSFKDAKGEWSKIRNLGSTINTSGFEMSPFLSADKTTLYFSSSGHSATGDADVFFSERLYNSWETWSVPKKLPAPINTGSFDAYFSLYGDSVCYFASNRDGGSMDIYMARVLTGRQYRQSMEDASRLIEDSKAILSEIRGGASNQGAESSILGAETIQVANETEIRKVITQFAPSLDKSPNAKILLLSNANSVTLQDLGKVSELIRKAGIAQNRIEVPAEARPAYIANNNQVQTALGNLRKGEALIVLYNQ